LAAGLATGGSPLRAPYRGPLLWASRSKRRFCPQPSLASLSGWPWPQPSAPLKGGLGRGLAMGGRPCMGAGCGWSPLLFAAFAAKTHQEHVE
ncbi:hypothetical protein B296_00045876, partial [Ensete ventricosum]